jgi:hypothetical protein
MIFLSPLAGLVALLGLPPLVVFALGERRRGAVYSLLGLDEPRRRRRIVAAGALGVVALLLGAAATQPTVVDRSKRSVRTDAEAFVVFDTSKSMLARRSPGAPDRLDRARALAVEVRSRLGDIPVGIASMTDRVLPHLFPSPDPVAFAATAVRTVAVDQPPPANGFDTRITTLGSLSRLASDNFYSPRATHRLAIVFTDGETVPFADASVATIFRKPPAIRTIFVRLWGAGERVFLQGGRPDPLYRPDPIGATSIAELAVTTDGVALPEGDPGRVASAARRLLGDGPHAGELEEQRKLSLAPFLAVAALGPLALLLWRRNL